MTIYKCGTRILSIMGNIEGTICEVSIKYNNVIYLVSYFHNGENKTFWLHETEFTITDGKKQSIGFKKHNS